MNPARGPITPPRGTAVRFFGALDDGRRSPSTWRIWTAVHSSDVYVASRHLAGLVKTSLHVSGQWQTSLLSRDSLRQSWPVPPPGRHLDRWSRPAEFAPGFTHALMIVIPWTQLLPWTDSPRQDTCRLMMEVDTALAVDVLILQATVRPVSLRFPDTVVFGRLDIGEGNEVVLLSRRMPWTAEDAERLEAMKTQARSSARMYVDPRTPPRSGEPGVIHITRLTHFGTDGHGRRYIVDAFEDRPFQVDA
jgi:hypothetical protein